MSAADIAPVLLWSNKSKMAFCSELEHNSFLSIKYKLSTNALITHEGTQRCSETYSASPSISLVGQWTRWACCKASAAASSPCVRSGRSRCNASLILGSSVSAARPWPDSLNLTVRIAMGPLWTPPCTVTFCLRYPTLRGSFRHVRLEMSVTSVKPSLRTWR